MARRNRDFSQKSKKPHKNYYFVGRPTRRRSAARYTTKQSTILGPQSLPPTKFFGLSLFTVSKTRTLFGGKPWSLAYERRETLEKQVKADKER